MIRAFLKSLLTFFLMVAILAAGFFAYVRYDVTASASASLFSPQVAPSRPVAMVLGAEVLPDLVPSAALATRLDTAISLYKRGAVQRLLMSGDGRSVYYDEVETMRHYAMEHGVPDEAIVKDPSGLRTYDSCLRARTEFGIDRLIVVSQREHVMRAVYTCRRLGVDAVGAIAPEFSGYPGIRYLVREQIALLAAWIELRF